MLRLNKFHQSKRSSDQFIRFSRYWKKSSLHKDVNKSQMRVFGKPSQQSDKLNSLKQFYKNYSTPINVFGISCSASLGYYLYKYGFDKDSTKLSKSEEEAIEHILNSIIDSSIDNSNNDKTNNRSETANEKTAKYSSSRFKPVLNVETTFNDIQGCDEAKQDLENLVAFLRDPVKFNDIGATLPKGVILVGPPGVGKTSLAKAVAGEAKVPFIYANSSEFDEMYVGVGASRIRELFETAKLLAPCVVFLDELDAVGSQRTHSALRPSQNQTVSQLLSELDGFQSSDGILVLAATNNKIVLDKALIRPGRFDVEVDVLPPDFDGRKSLFQLYLTKISCSTDINLTKLANGSPGFTGATIKNMVNQAAILASLRNDKKVDMDHLWQARDRIIMGTARKRLTDEDVNKRTAFHEAGHALISFFTKESLPLHKVTIIPRNNSLGHTSYLDEKERPNWTRAQLQARIDSLMGGKVAEEMIYGVDQVTTGASDDLKKATLMAQNMVLQFGMSSELAFRTFNTSEDTNNMASETKSLLDKEVESILRKSYVRVQNLIEKHRDKLTELAQTLVTKDTLDSNDVSIILSSGGSSENNVKGSVSFLDSYKKWIHTDWTVPRHIPS